MWWDCVFKKQKTEQNRKKGRGRKRRKKRRRNCSKKWLGTVRIAGSRGLALSAGELFQWANETVRRTSEVSVLLFFFLISPDYFTTPWFSLFQVLNSDKHQPDETQSTNELDLDVKVLVANTHISYLRQAGSRQKQRLLTHSQSLSAQVTHDLVQATNESGQRARRAMPSCCMCVTWAGAQVVSMVAEIRPAPWG